MQPVKYQRSAPSVELLNEIDILLTQVRLAELYLKQAQAAAANQFASIQERYESQLENLRAGFAKVERDLQERLDESDQQLRRKQASLDESESELHEVRANLAALQSRIAGLETDIAQAEASSLETERTHAALESEIAALRTDLDNRDRLLVERQAELVASRQNLVQLETAQRMAEQAANSRWESARSSHEAEIAQLRATLADREHAFAEREREVKISLERHTAEIAGLRARLSDEQSSLEQRTGELQEARSEIATLRKQAEQLTLVQKQTERLLAVQAEQIRQRVSAELADLDGRLASKDHELQAVRGSAAEAQANLNATITGLRLDLAETLQLVEGRDKEIADLNASVGGLSEHVAQLTSTAQDADSRGAAERERVRLEHQAELLDLHEELRGKQQALAEQETWATERERGLGTHISDLETELAARQRLLEERGEALNTVNSTAVALQERLTCLEASSHVEQITQLYQAQIAELRAEIQRKSAEFEEQGAARNELVRTYRTELCRLRAESQEKLMPLDSLNEDLLAGKNAMDSLRERLTQLETTAAQAERTGAIDRERPRAEYEAQLAALREDLSPR